MSEVDAAAPMFLPEGGLYRPTERTRSPWSLEMLHGGPVAALLASGAERLVEDPGLRLARLTVDLFRPVPYALLGMESNVVRAGKRIVAADVTLTAGGAPVARAAAVFLRTAEAPASPMLDTPVDAWPAPTDLAPRGWGMERADRPGPVAHHNSIDLRFVASPNERPGRAWMRVPMPLLPDRPLTPAERAAAVSDFANPLSNMGAGSPTSYINADITLYLHRPPVGEWIGVQIIARAHADGVAVADARLRDRHGAVGHSLIASMVNEWRADAPGAALQRVRDRQG